MRHPLLVHTLTVVAAGIIAASASASPLPDGSQPGVLPDDGPGKLIPLMSWEAKPANSEKSSKAGVNTKAASDLITVYRPLTPCRLVDTRGFGAPIQGGAIVGTAVRTITTAGNCGVPTSNVRSLSVSVTTYNYTVNNGGYITFVAPGAAISTSNDIFNPGQQWSGTTGNVPTDNAGTFAAYVAQSTIDLIIDVNGYYQDMNTLDSNTQMDMNYSGGGDAFAINVDAANSATAFSANAPDGTALRIASGKLAISGATTINGSRTAFIHEVSAGSINATCLSRSNISHPLLNNTPGALLFVSAERNYVNNASGIDPVPVDAVEYVGGTNVCAVNQWRLKFSANAHVGDRYQILIVLP